MEDHRHGRAGARPGLETAFKAAFGTGKDNCGHVVRSRIEASLCRGRPEISGRSGEGL
jgi:hypothetical protein